MSTDPVASTSLSPGDEGALERQLNNIRLALKAATAAARQEGIEWVLSVIGERWPNAYALIDEVRAAQAEDATGVQGHGGSDGKRD